MSVILPALAGGAVLGWRSNGSATIQDPRISEEQGHISDELTEVLKHEEFLKSAVKEYSNPKDSTQFTLGVSHCLELAMFYLDRARFADADRFFGDLVSAAESNKAYASIGRLGHAMVLGFQDQATESVRAFLEVVHDMETGLGRIRQLVNRNPRFLQMMARALDHDAINYAAAYVTFPPVLEELRKPQPLPGPAAAANRRVRGQDKPPAKKP
jgi:hypothetical protein